ncbi:MAG: PDGLE domain-containing protein [Nitrospirota bacterium]
MRNERRTSTGMSTVRRLWIAIGILALLSPLGVIVPKWLGAGGAWGEWGTDEIRTIMGYVPAGMKRLADRWKAPLPDYALPGQSSGLLGESLGYVLAGVIGIAFTAGAMYILTKLLTRKDRTDRSDRT